MAEEVQIPQSNAVAKVRNPLGVVGLALVTIGVYFFFWWYFINREMRDLGKGQSTDLGQSPGNSVLAVTLGAIIIVPPIVSMWRTSERVSSAQTARRVTPASSAPVTFLLLFLVGPVGMWYVQRELNKVWESGQAQSPAPQGQAGAEGTRQPPQQ